MCSLIPADNFNTLNMTSRNVFQRSPALRNIFTSLGTLTFQLLLPIKKITVIQISTSTPKVQKSIWMYQQAVVHLQSAVSWQVSGTSLHSLQKVGITGPLDTDVKYFANLATHIMVSTMWYEPAQWVSRSIMTVGQWAGVKLDPEIGAADFNSAFITHFIIHTYFSSVTKCLC